MVESGAAGTPGSEKPKSAPSMMVLFAGLCLAASLFFPRFLVGLPVFGCLALCVTSFVRKERWRGVAVVIGVLALGVLVLLQIPTEALAAPAQVTYSVTGTAPSVGLTLTNEQGGTEQSTETTPWSKTFTGHSGQFVYISAQNKGDYGDVTCSITVNGTVIKTSTSSDAYAIADCSGSVP